MNPDIALTNERLHFARLHLEWLEAALLDLRSVDRHARARGLYVSTVMLLASSHQALLYELARFYKLPAVTGCSAIALQQQLQDKGQYAPELARLHELVSISGNALHAVQNEMQRLQAPAVPLDPKAPLQDGSADAASEISAVSRISMSTVSRDPVSTAQCEMLHAALVLLDTLISDIREQNQEW